MLLHIRITGELPKWMFWKPFTKSLINIFYINLHMMVQWPPIWLNQEVIYNFGWNYSQEYHKVLCWNLSFLNNRNQYSLIRLYANDDVIRLFQMKTYNCKKIIFFQWIKIGWCIINSKQLLTLSDYIINNCDINKVKSNKCHNYRQFWLE